jgi:hypothetical protein
MPYVLVLLVSLAVGAVVYVLSMRAEEPEPAAVGFEPTVVPLPAPEPAQPAPSPGVEGPAPGYTYLQVAVTRGPSARERIQGFVGSLALVAAAAVALAAGFYAVGALIGRLIRSFLGTDGS